MGISGQPPIASTYATIFTYAGIPEFSVPGSTSVTISADSGCVSESSLTNPGRCPAPGNGPVPACSRQQYFSVSITVKCDSASGSATSCTNFANRFDTDIEFDDPDLGNLVSVSAYYSTNICDQAAAKPLSQAFFPNTTKKGKFRIVAAPNINGGSVFTVKLIGAELLVGNDPTKVVTLDGTYAGKIITIRSCTP